jgi:hypothetical protein
MNASEHLIPLRGGLTVPSPPLFLLLDLESRGFRVSVDAGDLLIEPSGQISEAERALLRRWKAHVVALVTYDAAVQ